MILQYPRLWVLGIPMLGLAVMLAGCGKKSSDNPEKILDDMIQASSRTSFTGTKTFESKVGDQYFRFRLKIAHHAPDKTRLEFLEPERKKGQVIIKSGEQFWHLGDAEGKPVHYKRFGSHRSMEIRNLGLLLQNYKLHHLGREAVANRMSDIIEITSRSGPRLRRLVWVDKASRLPLRSEERRNGAKEFTKRFAYEQIQFTQDFSQDLFEFSVPQGARSALPGARQAAISLKEARSVAPFPVGIPSYLPKGFILEKIRWIDRPPSGFLHFLYSDGLQALSLFQEDTESFLKGSSDLMKGQAMGTGEIHRMRQGAMTILHCRRDNMHCTLVGEIEPDELIKMISSLESYKRI